MGRAGEAAHVHEGHVGAADPAGGDPDEGVARARVGLGDLVEADVVGPVHADLLHRAPLPEAGGVLCSSTGPDPGMRPAAALDRRGPAEQRSLGSRRTASLTGRAASRGSARPGGRVQRSGGGGDDRCLVPAVCDRRRRSPSGASCASSWKETTPDLDFRVESRETPSGLTAGVRLVVKSLL